MSNTLKCQDCKFFDPIIPPKNKVNSMGWCSKKSVYPAKEGPGQVFPDGVKRVAAETSPAKPVIVRKSDVISTCTFAMPKVAK